MIIPKIFGFLSYLDFYSELDYWVIIEKHLK